MQDAVNAMEAPMKESAKKRRFEEPVSANLARQKKERADADSASVPPESKNIMGPNMSIAELQEMVRSTQKTPVKQSASEWMAEREGNARRIKSGTPGPTEADIALHHSIIRDSAIKRREDGVVNTLQNQHTQQLQDDLIVQRQQEDRAALMESEEYDQLTPAERNRYDMDKAGGESHAQAMASLRKDADRQNLLGAREEQIRDQQQLHINNISLTSQDDRNINILAEEKKQIVGGELASLRGPLVTSVKNLKRAKSVGGESLLDAISQNAIFLPSNSPFKKQQDSTPINVFGSFGSPGEVKQGRLTQRYSSLLADASQREQMIYTGGQLSPDQRSTVASPGPISSFVERMRRHSSPSPNKGSVHPIMSEAPLTKLKAGHVVTQKGNKVASTLDANEYGHMVVL